MGKQGEEAPSPFGTLVATGCHWLPDIEHLCYPMPMSKTLIRTICCKLDVDGHETALAATQRAFNAAATWIAKVCWNEGITNTNTAHHRVYGETRLNFGLGAQLAVCARAKAVEAIKAVKAKHREHATCPQFGPRGSIRYDARTYRLMSLDRVSLNTLDGRVVCRLLLGARQHAMLVDPVWAIGGADLVWRRGVYSLHVTQSRESPDALDAASGTWGGDLGIVNLATDSEGETFSGANGEAGPRPLPYPPPTAATGTPLPERRQPLHQQSPGEESRRIVQGTGS
ncbi:MAG TPA: hypothetical protein VFW76_10065 [Ktedonobacterales bacterium]|nr:hypothetical protein [Ktedonobacterales bacterium]